MNKTVSTAEVLGKARDLIRDVGWCQNKYQRTNSIGEVCAYCATGAINQAVQEVLLAGDVIQNYDYTGDSVRIAVRNLIGTAPSIPAWNDDPARTKEDVLYAFDLAIERQKGLDI